MLRYVVRRRVRRVVEQSKKTEDGHYGGDLVEDEEGDDVGERRAAEAGRVALQGGRELREDLGGAGRGRRCGGRSALGEGEAAAEDAGEAAGEHGDLGAGAAATAAGRPGGRRRKLELECVERGRSCFFESMFMRPLLDPRRGDGSN